MKTASFLITLLSVTAPRRCRSFEGIACNSLLNRRYGESSPPLVRYWPPMMENPRMCPKPIKQEQSSLPSSYRTNDCSSSDAYFIISNNKYKYLSKVVCKFAPLWTVLAAVAGINKASIIAPTLGSLSVMQKSLSTLMLAMGLTITPKDFAEAVKKPSIIILNALLCFGMMPLAAMGIASVLQYNPSQTAGIVLLGSVSGGQASNLFTLLAGGDVALSVVCTLSTTFLGVLATPLLIKCLLNTVVPVDFMSVLQSVANLILLPLLCGLVAGRYAPRFVERRISPFCPMLGVLSTLILVAGGAATSSFSLGMDTGSIIGSCLLPIFGGGLAFLISRSSDQTLTTTSANESSRRTLVIETLSKSPTLAYVLARKHFGPSAATVPAAGMISLAVIGVIVASTWSFFAPIIGETNG